jgi:hypothetical protein
MSDNDGVMMHVDMRHDGVEAEHRGHVMTNVLNRLLFLFADMT